MLRIRLTITEPMTRDEEKLIRRATKGSAKIRWLNRYWFLESFEAEAPCTPVVTVPDIEDFQVFKRGGLTVIIKLRLHP